MRQKIMAVLLSCVVLTTTLLIDSRILAAEEQTDTVVAYANSSDEVNITDFSIYEYRADIYLNEETVCNKIIQNMLNGVTTTFPSQVVVTHLDSKSGFQNSVDAWKVAHFATSPSQIAEGALDEQGYYTAIILSVFKAQTENETYILDNVKEINSNTNKMLSNMKKWVKEADEIELESVSKDQILTTISIEEQKKIRTYLTDEFKKNHLVLETSSTITKDVDAVFDAVDTLGEAIELMESYIQLVEMSDSMKAVLLEMYKQCPDNNLAMKAALYESACSAESLSG